MKLNQKGVVHLLLPIILLLGLIVGVYLVTSGNPLKFFSKASNPPIVFKNVDGSALPLNSQGIPVSTSSAVLVKLTSTLTLPSPTPIGIGSTAPIGIGSTTPIGIGNTAYVGTGATAYVPSATISQSFTVGNGNNLIGLTVDKGSNYFAEDFLRDLNRGISGNRINRIYKTDPATNRNITHNLGTTADNFPIKVGEGYFIQINNWKGTIRISGTSPQLTSIIIPKGNSLISFWQVTSNINKAESLLQAMKSQGIQVSSIAKYEAGRYQSHTIGYPFNNFDIKTGIGYSIKNNGDTKSFQLSLPVSPAIRIDKGRGVKILGVGTSSPFSVTPISYRIAETPTELNSAAYQPYPQSPTVITYTFKDPTPGQKFLWVEFKTSDGRTDRRSAQIEIKALTPTPVPSPTPTSISFSEGPLRAVVTCNVSDNVKSQKHIDVIVSGSLPQPLKSSDGIWGIITDQTADKTIVFGYFGNYFQNTSTLFHGQVISIRNQGSIDFVDGRSYIVKMFYGPYTYDVPTIAPPFAAQITFNTQCTSSPVPSPTQASVTRPFDLDVTYLERTPKYPRHCIVNGSNFQYVCPGTEDVKHNPVVADTVTFKAKVVNKGIHQSGNFNYQWLINDTVVQSGQAAIPASGQSTTLSYNWSWKSGDNKVRFLVTSPSGVSELSLANNQLENYTNALSFRLHVEKSVYDKFNSLTNIINTYSFEDWAQYQLKKMNDLMVEVGGKEHFRIDEIVIEDDNTLPRIAEHAPLDMDWDGRWGFETTEWMTDPNKITTQVKVVQNDLLHEWGHQMGLIDSYNLNYDWNDIKNNLVIPQCKDFPQKYANGVNIEAKGTIYEKCMYYTPNDTGIMNYTAAGKFTLFNAQALNTNLGYRRGYFGEYLYDIPAQNTVKFTESSGIPLAGAAVSFYQKDTCTSVPNQVTFSGTTDNDGKFVLPNRPAQAVTTVTGHTQRNNPFGTINVVGCNGNFLVKITSGLKTDYQWLDIASFNLEYWKGNTQNASYEIKTNIKNLALNKTASAITSNGDAVASRAVDGDKTSTDKGYWAPFNYEGKVGDWWQVDLGKEYPIYKINVYSSAANGHDWFQKFHIEVSSTGAFAGEQQTVATETNWDAIRNWTNKAEYKFNSISARYIRITADSAFNFTRLQEVEVYEADSVGATLGVNTNKKPSLIDQVLQFLLGTQLFELLGD